MSRDSSTLLSANASRLRTWARSAVAGGGAGSLGLLLSAGKREGSPALLMLIMAIWVVAPFVALELASLLSTGWTSLMRRTLHAVMILIAIGSLVIYIDDAINRRAARAAFVYVVVPAASWAVMAVAAAVAAWMSRRFGARFST
jgi:hypothetical protein